jgi:excisionase family DNA binding protein
MDEYLTTNEIASLLKVKLITVRRWIGAGKLPAMFLGKEYRVKKSDFEKFLADRQVRGPRRRS